MKATVIEYDVSSVLLKCMSSSLMNNEMQTMQRDVITCQCFHELRENRHRFTGSDWGSAGKNVQDILKLSQKALSIFPVASPLFARRGN